MKSLFRDTVAIIIIAVVIIFGLQTVAQKFVIEGPSMNDTLHDEQQLLVNKLVYNFHEPERGDIIVFQPPNNNGEEYIKRIIGLPGELVVITDGTVFIYQADETVIPLYEPYISEPAKRSFEGDIIPGNSYFVLGDNRNNSSDSRSGWTLPLENIIGKAWLSVWPPDRWGLIPNGLTPD